ncbi:recombinase [Clostridia bacterium]|nr:recombinase [Clostridia bacterium]
MDKQEIHYRAVKYIRLSNADDKRDENGRKIENTESDSVQNQRRLIDDWLKNHPEIEVICEKIDDGWSGLLFDRPAFKEMMQEIESGNVNCCITKDLSRLGRESIATGRYLRQTFPALGVRFIAINDNIDTVKDSGDDLSISLKNIINDAYCRDISVKTRTALDIKRADGAYVGACPVYGYKKSEDNHNQLVPDDYAADNVREIFRMKLAGMSAVKIADTLNSRGVLSPHEYKKDRGIPYPKKGFSDKDGAKWGQSTIIRILQDETYTGTLIQGRQGKPNYKTKEIISKHENEWHRVENAHEAIIGKHHFDLAQKIMRLDTRTSPGGDSVSLFSGILVCGTCGNRMTRYTVPSGKKKFYYYRCPTGKKNGCNGVMLNENDLTDSVLEIAKSYVANVASLETIIASLDAVKTGRELAARLTAQLNENERRLDKIREFKAGLYENMMCGIISKDERKALNAKYCEDADALIAANIHLRGEIDDALSCKHERTVWIENFREFENLESIDRRTVVHLIRVIRVLGKHEIEITFNYQDEYESIINHLNAEVA